MGEEGEKKAVTVVVMKLDMHCEGCGKKIKRLLKHHKGISSSSLLILSAINDHRIRLYEKKPNADSLILLSGVEDVEIDYKADELTVIGNVDPAAVRDKVADRIKRKVEILSTLAPKKEALTDEKKKEEEEEKKAIPPLTSPALPKEVMFKFHTFSSFALVVCLCTFNTLKLVYCYLILRLIIVSDVILFDVMQSTVVFKTKLHCEGCEHKIKRIVSKINGAFIIYP